MKLILTRHGETEENKLHIMQSHMPGTLSKEGIEQAEKLALRLKGEKLDAIISSDLKRAADTTEIILKFHPGVEVIYTEDLREGYAGAFTGRKTHEIDWSKRPTDAESREDFFARAKKLVDECYKKYQNKTILLVGHGGIDKMIIAYITGVPVKTAYESLPDLGNTSVSIFELKEDKNHIVHLLGDMKHLE